jgi:hypothetical protein
MLDSELAENNEEILDDIEETYSALDEYRQSVQFEIDNLKKEKQKFYDARRDYSRLLREDARDEEFVDRICDTIKEVVGKQTYGPVIPIQKSNREAILSLADMHFGKEFKVYNLDGSIVNEYSPEIFYERMEKIYHEVVEIVAKENLTMLHVFNLGDSLDGFLRNSQIWSLRYGVIESAIHFSDFMGAWFKKLSEVVPIKYYQTNGNHGELRLLDGKKGTHENENIEFITQHIISIYNEGNPNFEIVTNKSGFTYTKIAGFDMLGIHGEVSSLQNAVKEFAMTYDMPIDYLFSGHKHNSTYKNTGAKKGVIGVGSIVGSDDFSMKIRKASDAGCLLTIFTEKLGKTVEYTITVN